MDKNYYNNEDRQDVYQTGRTQPPKKHGGIIAVLLAIMIFLGGIASAMGILNVHLFHKIDNTEKEPADLSFATTETMENKNIPAATQDIEEPRPELSLNISDSPQSVENVPQTGGLSLQEIYSRAIPSVVSISCTLEGGRSSGTGVVLSKDGYVVTNAHVVEGARTISVLFSNEKNLSARLIGSDSISDLAVLHVDAEDLTPAEFGDSSVIQVGDLAVAIGDPLGIELRGTMTDGIISAINRDITTGGRTMTLLQTNAALNSGNSGGPLLNCFGQVIGINTMKIGDYMNTAGVEGLGFAIPSTTVKEIVDQLLMQGYVSGRPSLGIRGENISSLYQHLYSLPEGLYIYEIDPDSDAAKKGISPGDVLVGMDGTRILSSDKLTQMLYNYQAGDQVDVVIYRSGKSYQLTLTLGQAN